MGCAQVLFQFVAGLLEQTVASDDEGLATQETRDRQRSWQRCCPRIVTASYLGGQPVGEQALGLAPSLVVSGTGPAVVEAQAFGAENGLDQCHELTFSLNEERNAPDGGIGRIDDLYAGRAAEGGKALGQLAHLLTCSGAAMSHTAVLQRQWRRG